MPFETFSDLLSREVDLSAICLRDDGTDISWGALQSRSRSLARGFLEQGVKTGDRVGIWLPNRAAWLLTFLACAQLGAVAVSINTRFKSAEVGDLLYRSGCRLLVYWPGYKSIDFDGILGQCTEHSLSRLEKRVLYMEGCEPQVQMVAGTPAIAFDQLLSCEELYERYGTADSPCIIFTTSGTTKAPKLVVHSQRAILTHAANVASQYRISAKDRFLLLPPLCGVYGFCSMMSAISARAVTSVIPTWQPSQALDLIRTHRISYLIASNEAVAQLFDAASGESFPRMRFIVQANLNPVHANVAQRGEEIGVKVVGLYGSSEMQALFSTADFASPVLARGLSGGHPASRLAKVRTRDPESGKLCGLGQPGELEFFGPDSCFVEYLNDPEATRSAFTDDGYFKSGDLGTLAEDGSFIFLARMGDTLRLGGFLVSPSEIEELIQEHPSVLGCQIVGINMGTAVRPIAFVTARAPHEPDEQEIISYTSKRLAKYKVPVRVFLIDEFPVTAGANGMKVQKTRLRELAEQALQNTVA